MEEEVSDISPLLPAMDASRIGSSTDELVNDKRSNKFPQYLAAILATLGAFAFGTSLAWTSPLSSRNGTYIEKFLMNETEEERKEIWSWIGALMPLGAASVALVIGALIDKFGRKVTMLCLVLPFTVGWALIIWPQEMINVSLNENKNEVSENAAEIESPGKVVEFEKAEPEINNEEKTAADEEESPDLISPAEKSLLQKIIRKGLVENKNDIEVQRRDPNSPLYSVKSFQELNLKPELLRGLYAMGFNTPSKIQEATLPALLADPPVNLIAQSQSGTGKTAAFVLAMLSRIDLKKTYPQVLCLSPTYELAIQTGEVACKMACFLENIQFRFAVRGEEVPRGSKLTEHIVIGTPGKVLDWGIKYKYFDISRISVFVLDEADLMISTQGHQDQVYRIQKLLPSDCQMMLFSATYEQDVMNFAESIIQKPMIMRLRREEESLDNIKQYYVMCNNEKEKYRAITNIYGVVTIGQAMIFCQTRKTASWLSEQMSKDGHAVAMLSGELTVEQRIAILDRFREGQEKVLITTNVLSRGIDIEQVTIVVNFDLPKDTSGKADYETYLHRIGRTGRFGKAGLAINLAKNDHDLELLKSIENHFGKPISLLDTEDVEEIEKLQD